MARKLTVREAAQALGIAESAVRKRIARGTLPAVRDAGAVYVLLDTHTPERETPGNPPGRTPGNPHVDVQAIVIEQLRSQLAVERERVRSREREATLLAEALTVERERTAQQHDLLKAAAVREHQLIQTVEAMKQLQAGQEVQERPRYRHTGFTFGSSGKS